MIALGRALRARGHDVTVQTWERWRAAIEGEGLGFAAAPEYSAFPIPVENDGRPAQPLGFYEAVVYATRDTLPLVKDLAPDVVVHDILTLAPSLCAELHDIPCATLIPHVFPEAAPGFPIYSYGAIQARTPLGRAFWRRAQAPIDRGIESGRQSLNEARESVGLPAQERLHGGTSDQLALVATFPQLEYARSWPEHVHVVGPLTWEPPAEDVPLPTTGSAGGACDEPLVLVAPSTVQDPEHRLLHASLEGLADAPVRVIATYNRRLPSRPLTVPDNARVCDWLSYARTLPHCEAIVCHAGHGTVVRALTLGVPVVACPVAGDMNENAARLAWAGAGLRVPRRFISPRPIRRAVEGVIADESIRERVRSLAAWSQSHDAGARAGQLVERLVSAREGRSRPVSGAVNIAVRSSGGGTRTHNLSINSRAHLPN